MPKSSPKPGGTFKYTGERRGQRDDAALLTGTVVTVRETVPAATPGAHDNTEDSVVIEWTQEAEVIVSTRFEKRGVPVMATADDGSVITSENGEPTFRLESRDVPVHEYGRGPVIRAMSIGAADFADNFEGV